MSEERTLGQLVTDATRDISDLVRHEVALAKVELKDEVKAGATAGGMFGGAAFLGMVAFVLLCVALALGLEALGLPGWVSFLIVAILLLAVAGVLALLGKGRLSHVGKPERTMRTSKNTVAAIKGNSSTVGPATVSSGTVGSGTDDSRTVDVTGTATKTSS